MGFVWLNCKDDFISRAKVDKIRHDLATWDWVNFDELDYSTKEEAYKSFVCELESFSLFDKKKIIYLRDLPSFHGKLPKLIAALSNSTILIIVSEIRKDSAFYKAVKKLDNVKIDEDRLPVDVQWIISRAELLGIEIEEYSCKVLLEFVGPNPDRIHNELKKLAILGEGKISSWIVEQAAYGIGEADIKAFCSAMLKKDANVAHELLQRIWFGGQAGGYLGEKVVKFFGFPMDWIRRLAIVAGTDFDEKTKATIQSIKKKGEDGVQLMFSNPNSLYYSAKALDQSGRNGKWILKFVYTMSDLQIKLRCLPVSKEHEAIILLHQWVDQMCMGNDNVH